MTLESNCIHNKIETNKFIREVERAMTFILSSFLGLFSGINSNNRDPIKGISNNDISII